MKKITLKYKNYKEGYVVEEGLICTGYVEPRYYSFDSFNEAKAELAGPAFEGSLEKSGMSKEFYDEDEEVFVRYFVDSEDEENLR